MRPYQDVHHGAYYCGAICAEASEHGANQTDAPEQRAWCLICRAEIPAAPDPEVVIDVLAMSAETNEQRVERRQWDDVR